MSRKPLTLDDPKRSFSKTIEELSHRHRSWEVFRDFCELSAISISNAIDWTPARHDRELSYHKIRERYEPEEFARFPFAFACIVESLEAGYDDVLGSLFMQLDLGSHWHGQFFTPYPLASMMARMTFDPELMSGKEFIRVQEPASGAGGMLIAFADAMQSSDFNPQKNMHATAIDVDSLCVHMSYIQLALLHIPAVVIHGNTLTLDEWSQWYTPAHVMGAWNAKLRREQRSELPKLPEIVPQRVEESLPADLSQLSLFEEA